MPNRETTRRRDVLRTAGAAVGTLSLAALAGCGTNGEDDDEEDEETEEEEDVAAADEGAETDLEAAAGPR